MINLALDRVLNIPKNSAIGVQVAIADNLSWCSAVCAANASVEELSPPAWINLKPSPPFYPNIITREPNAQSAVVRLIERLKILDIPKGWGIKDSFCDLALENLGFEKVLKASWFGGIPAASSKFPASWKNVASSDELLRWETAWGGDQENRIFQDALLADMRVEFWFKQPNDTIEAGFTCFHSGPSIGLSNWFSVNDDPLGGIGALEVIGSRFPGVPVVFWSLSNERIQNSGITCLAPLQVWISKS
ncbi:hypothetical protein C8J36_11052 [Rhizobium sp. PP-F2F-G48]|uniref:hypothetical protein n=1 Tax=Rhizobium sp. PP-F2F-G48 TaxID=2135651 RepID=UPI00104AE09F|nr:hypothetical protein [Rhizobium sp. PP-F2F-G48]TCM51045.1 hypothetical protein C8J36_11052 [Rhizobium sp. PP-F2F-G48]